MGQKQNKNSTRPLVQIVFMGKQINLYQVPSNFSEFESIAYNLLYKNTDSMCPFASLEYTLNSKGFLKQRQSIHSKKTYKKVLKCVTGGPVQIIIDIEKYCLCSNSWILNLGFQPSENEQLEKNFIGIKEKIAESQEDFSGFYEAYAGLLKISNQLCRKITVHDIKTCAFSIIVAVAADPCKLSLWDRLKFLEELPYIEFNSSKLSESSLDVIQTWNDFSFFFQKCLKNIQRIIGSLENTAELIKTISASEYSGIKHTKNYELIIKSIDSLKKTQNRLKIIEESLRNYVSFIKKPATKEALDKVYKICVSSGCQSMEGMMSLFSISSLNNFN